MTMSYGGYYGSSQSYSFCTSDDDSNFCEDPYQCAGTTVLSIDGDERSGNSYQSFSNVSFMWDNGDPTINCNGGSSCQRMSIMPDNDGVDVNCNGVFSCLNDEIHLNTFDTKATIECNGYKSCTMMDVTYFPFHFGGIPDLTLNWYVLNAIWRLKFVRVV